MPDGLAGWGAAGRLRLSAVDEIRRGYAPGESYASGERAHGLPPPAASGLDAAEEAGRRTGARLEVKPAEVKSEATVEAQVKIKAEAEVKTEEAAAAADDSARAYAAIQASGASGIAFTELCTALGCTDAEAHTIVEGLQMDGAVYERGERLLVL